MNGEKFNSDRAPRAVGLYPHARKVDNILYLSGVGPRKAGEIDIPGVILNELGEIESYDIEKQCHSVFQNIRFILEDSGSSWENIIDVQVFLTNMKDDFKTYISRVRKDRSNAKAINMWIVSDNLLKGAALNSVQIAETLVKYGIK